MILAQRGGERKIEEEDLGISLHQFFTCYFSVSLVFVAFYHNSLSVRGSRGSALGS